MKRLNIWVVTIFGVVVVIIVLLVYILTELVKTKSYRKNYWLPSYTSESKLGIFNYAAIAIGVRICAPIGSSILKQNGSAVDAAIAVQLCMGVAAPHRMSLGGGFFMTVYEKKEKKVYFINAREKAPININESVFEENKNISKIGPLSIAVPGELKGYEVAHKKFGNLPWKDLFKPSIKLCKEGIKVTKELAEELLKYSHELKKRKETWKFLINSTTGEMYEEGDIFFQYELAKTYEEIAESGSQALYNRTYSLAKKFMKDLKEMHSIITEVDMEKYNVETDIPVNFTIGENLRLFTSPPPGSGALIGMMIKILSGYDITADVSEDMDKTILTYHRIIEAFKFSFARRFEIEDNKTTMPAFLTNITSNKYISDIRKKINDKHTYNERSHYGLKPLTKFDHGTSSVAIIAPNGDAVSSSSTINTPFGSTEISKSTGIVLNNQINDFSVINRSDEFQIPFYLYNRIKPERRPTSSMSPTIIVDSCGNVRLVISANGGPKIPTSILQVIIGYLWLGKDLKQSVDAPRLHHQLSPEKVAFDREFPQNIMDGLIAKNHSFYDFSIMNAVVAAIVRGDDNKLYANADFRSEGDIDGF